MNPQNAGAAKAAGMAHRTMHHSLRSSGAEWLESFRYNGI
jgi:hypothetical protein